MRIKNEDELLNIDIRRALIEEIKGSENKSRKREAYRRYQCFKDHTNWYVVELLLKQLDLTTVQEMQYGIANLSIVRKIIDKLAKVYANGVNRSIEGADEDSQKLQDLAERLDLNTQMKRVNRMLKLQKNTALYLKPYPVEGGRFNVMAEALSPFHYDVVEGYYNRQEPMAYIISDYKPEKLQWLDITGQRIPSMPTTAGPGDSKDQKIADSAVDQNQDGKARETYIFWSKSYHFTCDEDANIIVDADNAEGANPFEAIPIINFAIDQDGSFWAEGGSDLVDGAVLINSMLSHNNHVGVVQGYGQFYMVGKNLPRNIKTGPTKAIIAEYTPGEEQPKPEMGFLSANPQLDSVRNLIDCYIALLLTTNNLSTSGLSTNLNGGATTASSGIALVIDKAESLEDIQDQRQIFIDKEPCAFSVLNKILKHYGPALVDELHDMELPDDVEQTMSVKFNDASVIMSETEKLTALKLRKDLGIDSMIGLLKRDDPDLSDEDAEEKLKKIIGERLLEKQLMQDQAAEMGMDPDALDPVAMAAKLANQDPNAEDPKADPKAKGKKPFPVKKKKADEGNQDPNNLK